MIAQLTGRLARVTAQGNVILDVNGVGYRVAVPASVLEGLPPEGETLTLVTHTLVREDDISLFGFLGEQDLEVFDLLLSVSGIGPKAALALLSALPADQLAQAAAGEDVRTLTRVPGVGAKTAQRLVLELKDKLSAVMLRRRAEGLFAPAAAVAPKKAPAATVVDDVVAALLNLGYNKPEATRATEAAFDQQNNADGASGASEFGPLLRAALNLLTKGK